MNTLKNHGDAMDCQPAVALALLQSCPMTFPPELDLPPITLEMVRAQFDLTAARARQENVYGAIHTTLYCEGLIAHHSAPSAEDEDDAPSAVYYTGAAWTEQCGEFTLRCKARPGVNNGEPWFFRTATCEGLSFDGSSSYYDETPYLIWRLI